jgi:hypothetical protein
LCEIIWSIKAELSSEICAKLEVIRSQKIVVFKYGTLKSGRRREDKIKMDIQNVGWGGRNWIDLA